MRLATRLHFGVSLQGPFSLVPRLSVGGARVLYDCISRVGDLCSWEHGYLSDCPKVLLIQ